MQQNYYEILGVEPTSTATEVRKAYLKQSLKYHPDKNPDNSEEAKAKFVEIGAAYETLSDPVKRRAYNQELRTGHRTSGDNFSQGFSGRGFSNFSEKQYDNYRDAFDATVASMSEEELAAAVGAVTMLASVFGSIVGSRLLSGGGSKGNNGRSVGSSALGVAGSMVGSMVASELASSGVRALHQESVERIAYREECRRAVAEGKAIPDRPRSRGLGKVFKNAVENVINAAHPNDRNSNEHSQRTSGLDGVWRMADDGLRAAAANEARSRYPR